MKEVQRTEAKDNDHEEEDKNEETDWIMTLDDDFLGNLERKED